MNLILWNKAAESTVSIFNVSSAFPLIDGTGVRVYFNDTTTANFTGYNIHAVIG